MKSERIEFGYDGSIPNVDNIECSATIHLIGIKQGRKVTVSEYSFESDINVGSALGDILIEDFVKTQLEVDEIEYLPYSNIWE